MRDDAKFASPRNLGADFGQLNSNDEKQSRTLKKGREELKMAVLSGNLGPQFSSYKVKNLKTRNTSLTHQTRLTDTFAESKGQKPFKELKLSPLVA